MKKTLLDFANHLFPDQTPEWVEDVVRGYLSQKPKKPRRVIVCGKCGEAKCSCRWVDLRGKVG